jgi:hypothetical protein
MARFYMKMLGFGLLLLFCIFFGVSLATSGMERIQGPFSPGNVHTDIKNPHTLDAAYSNDNTSKQPKEIAITDEVKPKKPEEIEDKSLNFIGNKLGELLQIVSHHGIEWFVSLFDSVLGKG